MIVLSKLPLETESKTPYKSSNVKLEWALDLVGGLFLIRAPSYTVDEFT